MNFLKLDSKKANLILFCIGVALVLGGILLLVLAVPAFSSAVYKVLFALVGILITLAGAAGLVYVAMNKDTDPHFFRYDLKTGKNIPVSELTFDVIDERMTKYVRDLSDTQEQLWSGNVFEDTPEDRFGFEGILRPVLAYKMLYDLAVSDSDDAFTLFTAAEPALIRSLADALVGAGENRLPADMLRMFGEAESVEDTAGIADLIRGNRKYICRRMEAFVRSRDEYFY